MKLIKIALTWVVTIFCMLPCLAQVESDSSAVLESAVVRPAISVDTSKKEVAVDTVKAGNNAPVTVQTTQPEKTQTETKGSLFSMPDSLEYTKFLTLGAGYSTILDTKNDSVNFWKSGYAIGFGFGDHLNRYLAYYFTLDYGVYQYDSKKYSDFYAQRYNKIMDSEQSLFGPNAGNKQDSINAVKKAMADAGTSFANDYANRTRNEIKTVQAGIGLMLKPVKIGRFTPYVQIGANILFSLSQVTFIRPYYDNTLNTIRNTRVTFLNSSIDGSLSILSSLGLEYELNRKMKLFVDVKKNWADVSKRDHYGYMQWDIITVKAGCLLKIK